MHLSVITDLLEDLLTINRLLDFYIFYIIILFLINPIKGVKSFSASIVLKQKHTRFAKNHIFNKYYPAQGILRIVIKIDIVK